MPVFFEYIGDISPVRWGSYIAANTVLRGETFHCDSDELNYDGTCALTTGTEVLEQYDMKDIEGSTTQTVRFHYIMLSVLISLYLIVAVIAVRLRAYKLSH